MQGHLNGPAGFYLSPRISLKFCDHKIIYPRMAIASIWEYIVDIPRDCSIPFYLYFVLPLSVQMSITDYEYPLYPEFSIKLLFDMSFIHTTRILIFGNAKIRFWICAEMYGLDLHSPPCYAKHHETLITTYQLVLNPINDSCEV